MPEALPGVARLVAVASGKGGVGKTTVSVGLALALAHDGARVGLFDADLYGPNLPHAFGLRRTKRGDTTMPLARRGSEPYIEPVERFGLRLMSLGFLIAEDEPFRTDAMAEGPIVLQTLRDVRWGELDYLLVDLPPGTGEPSRTLLPSLGFDGVILVTTPHDLSLLDAGRSLVSFKAASVPVLGTVENMAFHQCPHCGERVELFRRSERDWSVQQLPQLGVIPIDPALGEPLHDAHPLVAASAVTPGAEALSEAAANLRDRISSNAGASDGV